MGDIWGESAQSIETAVNSGGNINYLKLADGDIKKVRILGTLADGLMLRGWLSFGLDSKPIYKTINETIPPEMLGNDKWGAEDFWFVKKEHRGSKAGLLLFNKLIDWFKSMKADRIQMTHYTWNPKIEHFYRKKGFEPFETCYVYKVGE